MQNYLIPIMSTQKAFPNAFLTQYAFNLTNEHCSGGKQDMESEGIYLWTENQFVGCGGPDGPTGDDIEITVKCLEFPGEKFSVVVDQDNYDKDLNSPDCPEGSIKYSMLVVTVPSLSGDCTVISIIGANDESMEEICDSPA